MVNQQLGNPLKSLCCFCSTVEDTDIKQASALQDGRYKENAGGRGKGKSKRCRIVVRKKKNNFRTEHWKINTLEALLLSLETFRSQHSGESIYRRGWEGEKKDAL